MRYWINVISRDHVQASAAGGFIQAGHGAESRLKRMSAGDAVVFYSPRTALDGGEPLQRFTAVADVSGEAPYEAELEPGVKAWRRAALFRDCGDAAVQPLIDRLGFITNKKSWGFTFRRGFFEIVKEDFETIRDAMGECPAPAAPGVGRQEAAGASGVG